MKNKKVTTVTGKIVCKPGDKCIVRNYRTKHKEWESGEVRYVTMGVRDDLTLSAQYRVMLTRKSITQMKPWGTPLMLTVGSDDILLDISNPTA